LFPAGGVTGQNLVTLDFSRAHLFKGFGLNIWAKSDHPAALRDELIRDANATAVRVSLTPDIDLSEAEEPTTVPSILQVIRRSAPAHWAASLRDLGEECRRLNLEVHAVFYSTPPRWRLERPGRTRLERTADPRHIADEARWVVAVLLMSRELGIETNYVEIANEPDGSWNTLYTPVQYVELVRSVKSELVRNNLLTTEIEGPGTSVLSKTAPYLLELERSRASSEIGAISAHDWDTASNPAPLGAAALIGAIDSALAGLPVHITEYNEVSAKWSSPPFSTGPKQRGGRNGGDTTEFGIAAAAEGLKLLGDGANEIILWEAEDMSWEHQSFGLLDMDGKLRPSAEAVLATFAKLPRNIPVTGSVADRTVVRAGKSPLGLIVMVANPSDRGVRIWVAVRDRTLPTQVTDLRSFPTPAPGTFGIISESAAQRIALALPPATVVSFVLR
jgi:hypothetical protein